MRHEDEDAQRAGCSKGGKADEALKAFETAEERGADPALSYNKGLALLSQESREAAAAFARAAARLEGLAQADAEAARDGAGSRR